ncbi:hypothetical protein HK101_004331 [Irineochytrium annulatum]|nr:hypothetical protein HK101_004331 [Irineochytrium annulatum]
MLKEETVRFFAGTEGGNAPNGKEAPVSQYQEIQLPTLESAVADFRAFHQDIPHPASILNLVADERDREVLTVFDELCNELLSAVGDFESSLEEMTIWKDDFLTQTSFVGRLNVKSQLSASNEISTMMDSRKGWFSLQDVMELTLLHAQQMQLLQSEYEDRIISLESHVEEMQRVHEESRVEYEAKMKQAQDRAQRIAREYMRGVTEAPAQVQVIPTQPTVEISVTNDAAEDNIGTSSRGKLRKSSKRRQRTREETAELYTTPTPIYSDRHQSQGRKKQQVFTSAPFAMTFLERLRWFTEEKLKNRRHIQEKFTTIEMAANEERLKYLKLIRKGDAEGEALDASFLPYPGQIAKHRDFWADYGLSRNHHTNKKERDPDAALNIVNLFEYDLSSSTYSPDGRIFQVEYALKAVDNSGTAIGIRAKDGVVLAVEKLVQSKLLVPGSNKRIATADNHIGIATAGMMADGRHLAQRTREEAESYRNFYKTSIPGKILAERVAQYVQAYTLYSSVRPFGTGTILAAMDKSGPSLFVVEPSGVHYGYFGCAIGKGRQLAKTEIEKLKLTELSAREAVKEAARIIYAVHDEVKDKDFELELSWVCAESGGKHEFVPAEVAAEAEAAAKAALNSEMDED